VGSPISGERPWRRVRRVIAGPAPAAGADWSVTVPAGKVWRLVSVQATLTTAVAVANRSPRLIVGDGDATFLTIPPVAVQAASLAGVFDWLEHGSAYTTAPDQVLSLPALVLEAGWTVGTSTTAIQAADQWSAQQLLVLETDVKGGAVDLGSLPDLTVEVVAGPLA